MSRSTREPNASTDAPPGVDAPGAPASRRAASIALLDDWVASNPWHPRLLPFVVYLLFLLPIGWLAPHVPAIYPALYAMQAAAVAWLLWRYRRLTPELTLHFHWLAVPTGVGLAVAWVALGHLMVAWSPGWFGPSDEPHLFVRMQDQPIVYHLSLTLRVLGMSLLVPLFEELFVRSACLRGLHSARKTRIGLLQFVEDLPFVGEWFIDTPTGRRIAHEPPMFTQQLLEWPVGRLSAFGVAASSLVFMVHHVPRDWPGTIACAAVWCGLLWWTNRPGRRPLGIGPIAWSHGITNACLFAYCVNTGDWQFL